MVWGPSLKLGGEVLMNFELLQIPGLVFSEILELVLYIIGKGSWYFLAHKWSYKNLTFLFSWVYISQNSMKILHFSQNFPNFFFEFFLCNCPETMSSTFLGMTLKHPTHDPGLDGSIKAYRELQHFLPRLIFFVMIYANENWPRSGGLGSKSNWVH